MRSQRSHWTCSHVFGRAISRPIRRAGRGRLSCSTKALVEARTLSVWKRSRHPSRCNPPSGRPVSRSNRSTGHRGLIGTQPSVYAGDALPKGYVQPRGRQVCLVPGLSALAFLRAQPRSEVHDDHARRNHRNPEDRQHEVSDQQRSSEPPFGARSYDREDVSPPNRCPLVHHQPMLPSTGPAE